jgi:hypothetical protein
MEHNCNLTCLKARHLSLSWSWSIQCSLLSSFLKIYFIFILPSMLTSPMYTLSLRFFSLEPCRPVKRSLTHLPIQINHLTPNGHYMGRTAQLTSRCCILYIYSTNIHTEYFKHAAHSPFIFSLQNAVYFIMLPFLVPVLFTFKYRVC